MSNNNVQAENVLFFNLSVLAKECKMNKYQGTLKKGTDNVNAKRNNKVLKTCRRYLTHVQRSVFEGTITEARLGRLKREIRRVIDTSEDSVMIYRFETLKYSSKEGIGTYEVSDNFL